MKLTRSNIHLDTEQRKDFISVAFRPRALRTYKQAQKGPQLPDTSKTHSVRMQGLTLSDNEFDVLFTQAQNNRINHNKTKR